MARSTVPNPSQRVAEVPAGAEGAGAKKSRLDEPAAVILAGDILRWVIPKVGKFPKNVRFGLGARIESAISVTSYAGRSNLAARSRLLFAFLLHTALQESSSHGIQRGV